ncbi:hypothetical protein ACSD4E_004534, partial [Escherichia coli]
MHENECIHEAVLLLFLKMKLICVLRVDFVDFIALGSQLCQYLVLLIKPLAEFSIFIQLPGLKDEEKYLFADCIINVRERVGGTRKKRAEQRLVMFRMVHSDLFFVIFITIYDYVYAVQLKRKLIKLAISTPPPVFSSKNH